MLHKMVHDASGEVTATTVVVRIHIDASLRKAIRLPEDVRQRAVKMKERETHAFQEIRERDANQPEGTESSDCSR